MDAHLREGAVTLRYMGDPFAQNQVWPHPGDVLPLEEDLSFCWLEQTRYGTEDGRLAGTVRPDQTYDLASVNVQTDALQNIDAFQVPCDNFGKFKQHGQFPR